MTITQTPLADLLILQPDVFSDERGFFMESFNSEKLKGSPLDIPFHQDNHSRSSRNILRGLHFQTTPGQDKLVRVVRGHIFDVAVDIRIHSATYGKWFGIELDDQTHKQLFIPKGFAHGFCVLSEIADVVYKCSSVYNPATEAGISWDDPDIGIKWPCSIPELSQRDKTNQSFQEYTRSMEELS